MQQYFYVIHGGPLSFDSSHLWNAWTNLHNFWHT